MSDQTTSIRVQVNQEPQHLEVTANVNTLLDQMTIAPQGVAVAINQVVVPSSQWPDTQLHDGDDIHIFQAIAGG